MAGEADEPAPTEDDVVRADNITPLSHAHQCAGAHAHAREGEDEPLTCHQVLEEAILELFNLGRHNGMTEAEIDEVMEKIMDDRAIDRRKSFKIHRDGESS